MIKPSLTLYRLSDEKKLAPVVINSREQTTAIAFQSLPVRIQLHTEPLGIKLLHNDGSLIREVVLRDRKS